MGNSVSPDATQASNDVVIESQCNFNDDWRKIDNIDPISVISSNHITRETEDCEKLKEFYIKVLGFKQVIRPIEVEKAAPNGSWLQLCDSDIQIHILQRIKNSAFMESPYNISNRKLSSTEYLHRAPHLALSTNNINDVIDKLNKFNIKFSYPTGKRPRVFFQDCDGYCIEIIQKGEYTMENGKESFRPIVTSRPVDNVCSSKYISV